MSNRRGAGALRDVLARGVPVVVPGVYDALSARMAERSGFAAGFVGGFGLALAGFGLPDTGLVSYGEVVERGRAICDAVTIPLVGDADTGYGNELNMQRTVRGFAAAGYAALMVEDQVAPKRCGHALGKSVVSLADAGRRVAAATGAREELRDGGGDIVVIARTDALVPDGIDAALARAEAFAALGADIVFVESAGADELARVRQRLGVPLMTTVIEGVTGSDITAATASELGIALVVHPAAVLLAAARGMTAAFGALGAPTRLEAIDFALLNEVAGMPEYQRRSSELGVRAS